MKTVRQFLGRVRFGWQAGNRVVGWNMTPEEAAAFFKNQRKTVLTFFGYMLGYENEAEMFRIVRDELARYSPQTALVNDGVTRWGLGGIYPLAKSLGFTTAGIVSKKILDNPSDISPAVDHICFMDDTQWGGKLPNSEELSPTSKAMVACSDVLIAIGGNDVSRDELLEGRRQGKPIHYYPAEMNHEAAIRHAKKKGLPPPESFMGSVHDEFGR